MSAITVDSEIFNVIGHKLIVALGELAQGFDVIATELEDGDLPRAEAARQIRELAHYATAMVKEISL